MSSTKIIVTIAFIGDKGVNRSDFINTVFSNIDPMDQNQKKDEHKSSKFTIGKKHRPLHKLIMVDDSGNLIDPENKQQLIVVNDAYASCVNTVFSKMISPIYEELYEKPLQKSSKITNLFSSEKKQIILQSKVQTQLINISNMYADSSIFRRYALDKMTESDMIFMFYDHRIYQSFQHILELYVEFLRAKKIQQSKIVMIIDTAHVKNHEPDLKSGRYCTERLVRDSGSNPVDVNTEDEFATRTNITSELHKIIEISDDTIHSITYNSAIDQYHLCTLIRTFIGSVVQKRSVR